MTNTITWENYKKIETKYPHIASFAYWTEEHKGNKAEPLLVANEEEFHEKLEGKLHANVVIVGLNFGISNGIEALLLDKEKNDDEFLEALKEINYMSNQYGGSYGKKALNDSFKGTCVEGAYMTDFFKFNSDDKEWKAMGIATKDGSGLKPLLKDSPELYLKNIEGLKYELYDIVGIKEDPIFIFLGSDLNNDREIKRLMTLYFPNSSIYKFSHYQRPGFGKKQFKEEADLIISQFEKKD